MSFEVDDIGINHVKDILIRCFNNGGKLLIAGNGGSAADAQHIAAEFLGQFKLVRQPLPAIALASDAATMSAIGNDFGFEFVFARCLIAFAKPGDVFLALSTSGRSTNIQRALYAARDLGFLTTIGFTGMNIPDYIRGLCHNWIGFEGNSSGEIQEAYMKAAHWICGEVEKILVEKVLNNA